MTMISILTSNGNLAHLPALLDSLGKSTAIRLNKKVAPIGQKRVTKYKKWNNYILSMILNKMRYFLFS